MLAPRCDRVLATDISLTAARRAVVRCAEFPGVEIKCADIQQELPTGPFDLVVFSEIGYYFDAAKLRNLARELAAIIGPGGEFIAVHWLGHSADHALHGDAVHDILRSQLPLDWVGGGRYEKFRIDQWRRAAQPIPPELR
jgi:SAM-dependent methyltransferase